MNKIIQMLEQPMKFFTRDFSKYGTIIEYTVEGASPFFWEDDCLIAYVRKGTGCLVVNQTPYDLSPGCLAVLHSFHVFRFDSLRGESMCLEIIIYPYPEMVHMDFVHQTDWYMQTPTYMGKPCLALNVADRLQVETLLESYQDEIACSDHVSALIKNCIAAQCNELFSKMLRTNQRTFLPESQPICAQIFLYIQVYSFAPMTPESVSKRFHLSVTQMNRELHRICMKNYQYVLNHARVSNAYSLMLRNFSSRIIAKQAGFSGESSYYRVFQSMRGYRPQQYRNHMLSHFGWAHQIAQDHMVEIQSYVLKNYRTQITCESCAKDLFLPLEAINRTIQAKYGPRTSFRHFLSVCRLRFAEGLLTTSAMPICDVAIESGFDSVHTFIRLFKRRNGVTPTQFRIRRKEVQ